MKEMKAVPARVSKEIRRILKGKQKFKRSLNQYILEQNKSLTVRDDEQMGVKDFFRINSETEKSCKIKIFVRVKR